MTEKFLEGRFRLPIYYEDTDFSGFVYHANYLKFFERAREELVGLGYVKELYKRGLHYVVARMELSFHLPAKHGDTLEIATSMQLTGSPVTTVKQTAFLVPEDPKKQLIKLVSATIKIVAIDNDGEATRVPDDVVAYFSKLADERTATS